MDNEVKCYKIRAYYFEAIFTGFQVFLFLFTMLDCISISKLAGVSQQQVSRIANSLTLQFPTIKNTEGYSDDGFGGTS